MKVKDLLGKIIDSYVEIVIHECRNNEHFGNHWVIQRHTHDYSNIPDRVMDSEVSLIVPYYDRISVNIEMA